jgi:hypothetical protein
MTTENPEAPKQDGAAAVACTDLLTVLRRALSDAQLHRRAAINRSDWKSATGFDYLTLNLQKAIALTANDRGQAQPPTATEPDRKNA